MPQLLLSLLAFLAVLLPGAAWAQVAEDPFRVEISPVTVPAGGQGGIEVRVQIPPEHHLTRDSIEVRLDDPQGFVLGEPDFPVGQLEPDPAFPEKQREIYHDSFSLPVPLAVGAVVTPGSHELEFQVRYQGCKGSLCFMPRERALPVTVTVSVGEGAGAGAADMVAFGPRPALTDEAPVGVRAVGGEGEIRVAFFQAEGWHVNRNMTWIELGEGSALTAGEAVFPAGHAFTDPLSGMERLEIGGDFVATLPVQGPAGSQRAAVAVGYQACKANLCLMPRTENFDLDVVIAGGTAAALPPSTATGPGSAAAYPAGEGDAFQRMRAKGLVWLVLFVFGAGFLVSLTPCVLPMIPITMGIIGARAAGSRWKALSLSLTYVAGLALVYTALGASAAFAGSIFGSWMQNVWVVGTVAVFFAAMGLAMFGLFDVAMPSGVSTRLNQLGGAGYGGAFVVGMVGALVAGPCSGPVVAALMVMVGTSGEVALGIALMLAFSLGMGVLFLLAGVFSSALMRPGAWMESVKRVFGVIMLIGAVYFVHAHLPAFLVGLLTGLVLLGTGIYAWNAAKYDGPRIQGAHRAYTVLGGLLGLWFLAALAPQIPSPIDLLHPEVPHVTWATDEAAGVQRSKAENKPMVVDFTAAWCAACQELEHSTYVDPRVIATTEGFVTVKIDATSSDDPAIKALLERYEVKGLPTVVFVLPDGTVMDDLTVTGFVDADDFLTRLTEARARLE
ncbi:MAG: cytochrome c biogenesis protein CcdA [Pseudomonadota bacterium]